MSKEELINNTIATLSKLPQDKVQEIADFSDFLLRKLEDQSFNQGIMDMASKAQSYQFLEEEEDLYTVQDIKEKYN